MIFVVEEVVLVLLPKNEGMAGGAVVEEVGRRVAAFFFLEAATFLHLLESKDEKLDEL